MSGEDSTATGQEEILTIQFDDNDNTGDKSNGEPKLSDILGDGIGNEDDIDDSSVDADDDDDDSGADTGDDNADNTDPDPKDELWEEIAADMGWRKKEDLKGDEGKFIDARTFVFNERKINARIKEKNERLLNEIGIIKHDVKRFREETRASVAKQREKHAEEIAALRKQYEEQKIEAIRDADVDEVKAIDDKLVELDKKDTELKAEETSQKDDAVTPNPVIEKWIKSNSWYTNDPYLTDIADRIAYDNKDKISIEDMLALIDSKVGEFKKKYGLDDGGNPVAAKKQPAGDRSSAKKADSKPPAVGSTKTVGGTSRSSKKPKHTFDDLDETAKETCKDFVKSGVFETRQEYVDDYFALN